MCISEVARVRAVDGHDAIVDVRGVRRRISLAPLTLDGVVVAPGHCLLVHTGMAVAVLDPAEAASLEQLWEDLP